MRNAAKLSSLILIVLFFTACNKSNNRNQETILKGKATLLVDETLKPIMEDQIEIFESRYEAKIKLDAKSENEVIQALVKDTSSIAVLSRRLNADEMKVFASRKIIPKTTPIAIDAIAFIANGRRTFDTKFSTIVRTTRDVPLLDVRDLSVAFGAPYVLAAGANGNYAATVSFEDQMGSSS